MDTTRRRAERWPVEGWRLDHVALIAVLASTATLLESVWSTWYRFRLPSERDAAGTWRAIAAVVCRPVFALLVLLTAAVALVTGAMTPTTSSSARAARGLALAVALLLSLGALAAMIDALANGDAFGGVGFANGRNEAIVQFMLAALIAAATVVIVARPGRVRREA